MRTLSSRAKTTTLPSALKGANNWKIVNALTADFESRLRRRLSGLPRQLNIKLAQNKTTTSFMYGKDATLCAFAYQWWKITFSDLELPRGGVPWGDARLLRGREQCRGGRD